MFGRRIIFVVTYGLFTLFNIGGATAQNIETILITRFFGGLFGAGESILCAVCLFLLFIHPALPCLFAQLLSPTLEERSPTCGQPKSEERLPPSSLSLPFSDPFSVPSSEVSLPLPASETSFGSCLASLLVSCRSSSFVVNRSLQRLTVLHPFLSAVTWIVSVIFVPETYAPTLLRRKAKNLTKASGGTIHYVSKFDKANTKTFGQIFKINLSRPFVLLFREPIVLLLSIYTAIICAFLPSLWSPVVLRSKADRPDSTLPFLRPRRNSLPLFHCVPHCVPANERLEFRRRRSRVPWRGWRHDPRHRHLAHQRSHLRSRCRTEPDRTSASRGEAAVCHGWIDLAADRSLLVRLDVQPQGPLDRTHSCRCVIDPLLYQSQSGRPSSERRAYPDSIFLFLLHCRSAVRHGHDYGFRLDHQLFD
jgi:hypothetical protein